MNSPCSVLVTGAGGFVGAATVRAALAAGHRVTAMVRKPGATRLIGMTGDLTVRAVDLSNSAAVATALGQARADVVIHTAWEGIGGPSRAGDIQFENIRTTLALVDAAIAAGARKFVGFGSQAEYGRFDRRVTELDLPQPTMLYGAAKLSTLHLARQRCEAAGIDFAWLRLYGVYGPGDNPNWLIPAAAASLAQGIAPKCTLGTQLWDYLHIDDAAAATLAVAMAEQGTGVFNLSSGAPIAVRAIIERLRDLLAPGLALTFGEIPFGPAQIMHLEGDHSRISALTGWMPKIDIWAGLAGVAADLQAAA
ncbi:MAG: NAD(P)-dependent oxidoreductase [Proteobacteria bacterium]|nr:NAD(P)-dependent oxidoreductase [Pseudomonadota bacterium]